MPFNISIRYGEVGGAVTSCTRFKCVKSTLDFVFSSFVQKNANADRNMPRPQYSYSPFISLAHKTGTVYSLEHTEVPKSSFT